MPRHVPPLLLRLSLLLGLLVSGLSQADLIPPVRPEARALIERAEKDPAFYQYADPYCAGRSIGDTCSRPGNPFEGGGSGVCRRDLARDGKNTARCALDDPPDILRNLPDGGFLADPDYCRRNADNPYLARRLEVAEARCSDDQAPVTDVFCRGKQAGDACSASLRDAQGVRSYPGRCRSSREERRFYDQGYVGKHRDLLLCQPETPTPDTISPASPPGWLMRIFQ